MQDLSLYENVIRGDKEFPAQLHKNHMEHKSVFFSSHWHEQVELHYILQGSGVLYCNQNQYQVSSGDLLIINSNELHQGICTHPVFEDLVLVFDIDSFSSEIAGHHLLFQPLIPDDKIIGSLFLSLFEENACRKLGYKIAMKGKLYDLLVHLMRNYVIENLSQQEGIRRKRDLDRLNQVLNYLKKNYMDPAITTQVMAEVISLSPGRFAHLFKDIVGVSPGAYLNQLRLKAAYNLLQQGTFTSTEIAFEVGFSDYNNFSRQFQRLYQVAPSKLQGKKMLV